MSAKKFFSNWIVRNIIWAAVVFTALLVGAAQLLNLITQHNKELVVPDFTNMSVAQAKFEAEQNHMRVEVTDSVYARRMARGVVYRQNPEAGSRVKQGRRIMLTINSVSPKKVQMPNLVGYSMRQARAELSSRGLNLGRLIYVDDIATNNVLKQIQDNREIRPGTMVVSGSRVDLVVGLNSEENLTVVPELHGMKYLHAVDVIHNSSLNLGTLKFDSSVENYSDSLDAVVVSQSPESNPESLIPVLMGSEVSISLSKAL